MAEDMECIFDMEAVAMMETAITDRLRLAREVGGLALEGEAKIIMDNSLQQIPVMSGAAKSTGFIHPGVDSNGDPTVSIGYDGSTATNPDTGQSVADYLLPLHERLDVQHENGKAKFLEDPLMDYITTLVGRLQDMLGSAFK